MFHYNNNNKIFWMVDTWTMQFIQPLFRYNEQYCGKPTFKTECYLLYRKAIDEIPNREGWHAKLLIADVDQFYLFPCLLYSFNIFSGVNRILFSMDGLHLSFDGTSEVASNIMSVVTIQPMQDLESVIRTTRTESHKLQK